MDTQDSDDILATPDDETPRSTPPPTAGANASDDAPTTPPAQKRRPSARPRATRLTLEDIAASGSDGSGAPDSPDADTAPSVRTSAKLARRGARPERHGWHVICPLRQLNQPSIRRPPAAPARPAGGAGPRRRISTPTRRPRPPDPMRQRWPDQRHIRRSRWGLAQGRASLFAGWIRLRAHRHIAGPLSPSPSLHALRAAQRARQTARSLGRRERRWLSQWLSPPW